MEEAVPGRRHLGYTSSKYDGLTDGWTAVAGQPASAELWRGGVMLLLPSSAGDVVQVSGPYRFLWGEDHYPSGQAWFRAGQTFPSYSLPGLGDCMFLPANDEMAEEVAP